MFAAVVACHDVPERCLSLLCRYGIPPDLMRGGGIPAGARNGNRTRTAITGQGILSPSCLPIPPSGHFPPANIRQKDKREKRKEKNNSLRLRFSTVPPVSATDSVPKDLAQKGFQRGCAIIEVMGLWYTLFASWSCGSYSSFSFRVRCSVRSPRSGRSLRSPLSGRGRRSPLSGRGRRSRSRSA